jgi:hypothetical protein
LYKPKFGASAIMVDGDQCLVAGSQRTYPGDMNNGVEDKSVDTVIISLGKDCKENSLFGTAANAPEVTKISNSGGKSTKNDISYWYGQEIE